MTATIVKELIKTYFIMVSIFGVQEAHKMIIKQLPNHLMVCQAFKVQ